MKPPQIQPQIQRLLIRRQTIRLIFITICSAIVVIVMGLSGHQSNNAGLAPEPAFQQASLASPQSTPQSTPQTVSASTALAFEKMPPTPPIKPLPIVPAKLPSRESVPTNSIQTKLGHFPYAEAEPDRLVDAGRFVRGTYERSERLDLEANQAFRQMAAAAKTQGVSLMPISGFRNIADQSELFRKQVARRGSETEAARASAPPGHSEHHTGYAIDIGDAQSDTDLKLSFQDTNAYQWLLANAPNYGFEQSFPLNNKQGINFEPWHWRYFGSPRAAQVFAAARQS